MSEGNPPPPRPLAGFVTAACLLAFLGLGVTVAHLAWPSPLLFTLFMVVGQGAFAAAMAIYLGVIFTDLRRRDVL